MDQQVQPGCTGCNSNRKENSQSLLLTHRCLRALPNCHGFVLSRESLLSFLSSFYFQCFTPVINSHTSKWPVGLPTGLTLHKTLFAMNLNSHMHHDKRQIVTQSQMGQLMWPVSFLPLRYISFISAMSLTDRNRLRIQQIYSTIFQNSLPPKERPSSTN